jgi:hypothetical protein
MLAQPSIDGEFTSVDDPGSDSTSTSPDQSPNGGMAMAATAVKAQTPAAPAAPSNAFVTFLMAPSLRLD